MPYVNVDVEVDLSDFDDDEILKEAQARNLKVSSDKDSILKALKDMGCPDFLYELLAKWLNQRLSLSELFELEAKR